MLTLKERNLLRDENGELILDENGKPMTLDDPEMLAMLAADEEDEGWCSVGEKLLWTNILMTLEVDSNFAAYIDSEGLRICGT